MLNVLSLQPAYFNVLHTHCVYLGAQSPEDGSLQGDSGEIPDDVIDDSDFNLEVDEGGYDSDSESETDEGEDPVGGTTESQPSNAGLPRNISEKVGTTYICVAQIHAFIFTFISHHLSYIFFHHLPTSPITLHHPFVHFL